jgi:hypothetical protein
VHVYIVEGYVFGSGVLRRVERYW